MGILTEEELNKIEGLYGLQYGEVSINKPSLVKLIASHRNLLSANAELSFRNLKLQEALTDIKTHVGMFKPQDSAAFYEEAYLETKRLAYKALEEFK